ncbi:MAG: AAA family ATPase [Deltaproteobacteria bacterium]|nr:AAA family ATPase [Deltaproteobacteria bacterium]MBW1834495.1 AAA family ATPase [Deltaproteobacteria bacterium]
MKIKLQNLGILKTAEFELGDLTIICGKNNTGKTYAVYTFYGFLKLWRNIISIEPLLKHSRELIDSGVIRIELEDFKKRIPELLQRACNRYSEILYKIFASSEKLFADSAFQLELDTSKIDISGEFKKTISSRKKDLIVCSKEENSSILEIAGLWEKGDEPIPASAIEQFINNILLDILFAPLFPDPFIASAERTGAAIFRKELDFARNRLLEEIGGMERDLDPFKLLDRVYGSYALPVKDNVDFTRNLENIAKKDSFIEKEYPHILTDFQDIIGGEYRVVRGELYYVPRKGRVKLTMDESSSAVRSLLDIGFYLKHMAQPGDMLIVDEPELNLHPENQRRVARLFARLVNIGIKVFITTHSDYIIKELNTLIMLKAGTNNSQKVMEKFGYADNELLLPQQVRVYSAGENLVKMADRKIKTKIITFTPCDIDPSLGVEVKGFDDSIIEMNRIQEDILFGGDE